MVTGTSQRSKRLFILLSGFTGVFTCLADITILFIASSRYEGYSQFKDTISLLGTSNSPVSGAISVWWIIMGLLLVFFGLGVNKYFDDHNFPWGLSGWLIIIYGVGEGAGSGLFKADMIAGKLTTSAMIHDVFGGIGILAVLLLPLVLMMKFSERQQKGLKRLSLVIFVLGIIFISIFTLRYVHSDSDIYAVNKGLWQRMSLLNTYFYFVTISFLMISGSLSKKK